ncbi:MAG: RHS repeat protein, partial [Clostridia bacterium]|nr:RHS repeat protein [Clostridia bacterium]
AAVAGWVNGALTKASDNLYTYGSHMTLVKDFFSGKTIRYHFNDNGNQISIDDELGYALYTRYDQSGENADTPINHATTRSRMQRSVKNLLKNPSFENSADGWEKSSSGIFSREYAEGHMGVYGGKLEVSQGEAYMRQAVTLPAPETGEKRKYTFSGYLRSHVNAWLRITYTIPGEAEPRHFDSDPVPGSSSALYDTFTRVAVSFTLPDEADSLIYCTVMRYGAYGYTWMDGLQLEEGLTCNHYNLLENGDFVRKKADGVLPEGWNVNYDVSAYVNCRDLSTAADSEGVPELLKSSDAVRLAGRYDRTIALYQDLKIFGQTGDRFTLGGWCKSFAKKEDAENYVHCRITAAFYPSNPTTMADPYKVDGEVNFNPGENEWQFGSAGVVAPVNFNFVRISVEMKRQMNHADFTNLYFYPEAFGTDYAYDRDGNRRVAVELFGGASAAEYDDHDNMTSYIAPGHTKSSTFNYGTTEDEQKKHLLLESSSPLGTKARFGYGDYGTQKRADTSSITTVTDENGASRVTRLITRNTTEYQHNLNYVREETDARGKKVIKEVDANTGVTTKVTDPKGQEVVYTHDALRRVTQVATQDNGKTYRNNYTYDAARGLLTSVKHNVDDNAENDVVYTFQYDALGRKTKVLVGGETLSENIYQNDTSADHYGTLTQMKYGNRTVVKNEYDDFNRITGIRYGTERENSEEVDFEEQLRYKYDYNANGQVARVENTSLKHVTESEYDDANRPCRVKTREVEKDDAGNVTSQEHIYTGEVAYENVCGRLSEFREKVGSGYTAYKTTIGYDEENRPTALGYGSHGESLLEYDGLGRIAKATVKAGNGAANTTIYTYVNGATLEQYADLPADVVQNSERWKAAVNADGMQSTTGLVASIQQTGGNFTYEYDDNGNITKVTQDTVDTEYTYDALGQLIRVVDGQEGATWEYTYDQGGNILSKKKFVDGALDESMTFGYVHEGSTLDDDQVRENKWRDLLKYVNGQRITYDKIGNPLNDGTWQYEWVNGRQLARMYNIDTDASFVYNENGLRVQKTVNGVVTDYTLHGKNIVHMSQGSNTLHFFYDAQNKPAVVVYNGTPYSYVKNLQGDIVAILNSAGTTVVQYKYDAWGRPISKTGSMAGTLGTVQPFRYRGYVYDEETGVYYLRSRYYNCNWCRFPNLDLVLISKLLYCNIFAYGNNYPTGSIDTDGMWGTKLILAFMKDDYAKQIVTHWIDGGGEDLRIENDASWD